MGWFYQIKRDIERETHLLFQLEITGYRVFRPKLKSTLRHTVVSTKVVPHKCESVRGNADLYYG